MKKKLFASKNEMKHSSRGIFGYKQRKPVKMIKGGHGERNIQYLKKHNLSHAINDIDPNGVRHGQIDCHVRPRERKPRGHVWFPERWNDTTIAKAGSHVANLKKNISKPDHTPMHGKYKKVHVVTYKSRGRICGICPKFRQEK
jgi:hypothetical protein